MRMGRLTLLSMCILASLLLGSTAMAAVIDVNKYWDAVNEETADTDETDSLMCWAATSSNVLDYTGWTVAGDDNYDAYHEYLINFDNDSGTGSIGYEWYFTEHALGNYSDYFVQILYDTDNPNRFLDNMAWLLDPAEGGNDPYSGAYGIYLSITNGWGGHAITVWDLSGTDTDGDGVDDEFSITVTDSDDSVDDWRIHEEHTYQLLQQWDRWYLEDYAGGTSWYMRRMDALAPNPESLIFAEFPVLRYPWELRLPYLDPIPQPIPLPPYLQILDEPAVTQYYLSQSIATVLDGPLSPGAVVPEPGTIILLGTGLLGVAARARKRKDV